MYAEARNALRLCVKKIDFSSAGVNMIDDVD